MRPIITGDVTREVDPYYTESFGPSVLLITVDGDDEDVDNANGTECGLSGAVFIQDLKMGLRVARHVENVAININKSACVKD